MDCTQSLNGSLANLSARTLQTSTSSCVHNSEAQRLPDFSGVRNFVPHGEGGTAGVLFQLLENDKAIMGVNFYGCTSVLVMSRRGVWVSANIRSCIRARH
jgi:hypothetical protein